MHWPYNGFGLRWAGRWFGLLVLAGVMSGCAALVGGTASEADWVAVSACAPYRPVDKPGMQRREAQNDAETLARRALLAQVGRMRIRGRETVNDLVTRDVHLRAELLRLVRTAEVYEWKVDEQRGEVCVWMRLDRHRVRELFGNDVGAQ